MIVAALSAHAIEQGPAIDAATHGFGGFLALGLSTFVAFYGLRFARRLLGA